MCNTVNPKNRSILNTINTHPTSAHEDFLIRHGFELSCFIQFGITAEKLNQINLELLKIHVEKEQISKDRLVEAGLHQSKIDEIFSESKKSFSCQICSKIFNDLASFEAFKQNCESCGVIGKPPLPPEPPINPILKKIINKKANVYDIQEALLDNIITDDQLRSICFFSDDLIQRIHSYTKRQMSSIDVDKLSQLKNDRTDFYFLGMPRAGKSCLIASLLAHWMKLGIANPEVESFRSVEYFNMLGGQFSRGILPMPNPNTFIDYIEITLNIVEESKSLFGKSVSKEISIPINILDLAGEKFEGVAAMGHQAFDKHKEFLLNKNSKALFFILDYSIDDAWQQCSDLLVVLNNLENIGILNYTDCIYLVVTKADMFEGTIGNYESEANKFIQEHYKTFYNRLTSLSKLYRFSYEILPYSIGECILGQLLVDYNPKSNKHLLIYPDLLSQKVLNHTGHFKGGYKSIFSN